ncbi:unnamed protein product [Bursaphelenchus okinawaensis]|uniref:Metalloendopeptidase n=1 Tax=Bursaphelenchus okinawaensis TaxID=465554 RepID=A0A811KEK8_9BILA|nr:unnamed protein product [Bursaphelenchus okinawaensis]CAG9103239.1 unnamed protein product [Bursaphelenchus okinawaensis]
MLGLLAVLVCFCCWVVADQFIDKTVPEGETVLSEFDFLQIRQKRQQEDEVIDDSAMYNKDRFEGDIVTLISPSSKPSGTPAVYSNSSYLMRNAVRQTYLKWPNGRIPYTISTQYTTVGRQRIAAAIDEYHQRTCIKFVPKTATDLDYVHILPEEGCYSLVGKVGGKQPVSLGNGCIVKGIIIHELMHAVGFFHEQSRADRDNYVRIVWTNVEPGLQDQFDKYSLAMIDHLNTEYDYGSVMHYGPTAFSKNGKTTVEPVLPTNQRIGQRVGFSQNDANKINKLYTCEPKTQSSSVAFGGVPVSLSALPDNTIQAACNDHRRDCIFLAERGHCTSSYAQFFMSENCPRSCGQCVDNSVRIPVCQDTKPWCERWAEGGMCQLFLFSGYMKSNCAKSCAQC